MFVAPTAGRATMRGVAGHASELDRKSFIADPTVLSELGVGVDDLGEPRCPRGRDPQRASRVLAAAHGRLAGN